MALVAIFIVKVPQGEMEHMDGKGTFTISVTSDHEMEAKWKTIF